MSYLFFNRKKKNQVILQSTCPKKKIIFMARQHDKAKKIERFVNTDLTNFYQGFTVVKIFNAGRINYSLFLRNENKKIK